MDEKIVINDNIPLDIYQTWFNKDLPQGMINSINKLKQDNPDFTFHLFDDNDCTNFIKENFGIKVSDAFDNLIPGAYKADLWRYCILYKKGGIYIDVKFHTNNFNLKQLTDKNYFVKDRDGHWEKNKIGIYNGFMISKPKNPIFLNCINDIIKNVNSGNMGINSLHPTGPGLIGNYFKNTDEFLLQFSKDAWHIQYKNESILSMYENYRSEQVQYQKTPHYSTLWLKNLIYKNTFNKIKVDRELLFDIILIKNIKTLIPSNIYQVYLDSVITEKVKNKSKYIQEIAPNFGYFLFSLYDCAGFIRKHFDSKIYTAYTKLKHVKNKLDLWKYCILYKYGGMYIDLNYNLSKEFNISLYILKNFYLKDTNNFIIPDLIMSEKGNTKLLNCIEKIVTNVNEYNYGSDYSEVSNSKLITSEFNNSDLDNIELILKDNKVYHDNVIIINSIDEDYFTLKNSNLDSWETKKIYQ
jgi:mannosyltransferase OCH1-like enzyme